MPFIDDLVADLRYAYRQLLKSPGFTVAAVATLALGIGGNSAIYSVIDSALIHPLPYPHADRLVIAWKGEPEEPTFYSFSYPRFRFFQEHARDFADIAVYDDEVVSYADGGEPERIVGGRISWNFLRVLGVRPQLGRDFTAEEDSHGAPPVALLSDRFWRARYHADPQVLGRKIRVDADEATVIGVLPPGVQFRNESADIWRSRVVDTRTFAPASVQLGASYLTAIGRLRDGISLSLTQARLKAIDAAYRRENPGNSDSDATVHSDLLDREIFANMRTPLLVLWGAVACLLLIACANVANLVLARALGRFREVAVRAALGASRWRIVRQLIAEGVLLSFIGGLAAVPVALWSTTALAGAIRNTMSQIPEPQPNVRVLLLTFFVSAAIGIVFGLAPIVVLLRGKLGYALHAGGRGASASLASIRLRQVVVAAEVALCVVLLSGAALLAQSLIRMSRMGTGIRSGNVVMAPLDLMPDRYQDWAARNRFYDELLRRARAIPGVQAASITSRVDLLQHGLGYMVQVEGAPDLGARNPGALGRSVSPGYFGTLGIPLLRGRDFSERDSTTSAHVMIVNETFAKHFFPGQDPVGKHVTYSTDRFRCEIVGLVRDVRSSLMATDAEPTIYLPLAQRPWLVARLLVRSDSPYAAIAAVRKAVQAVDPDQAAAQPHLLDEALASRLGQPRTTMLSVAVFAAVALLLAAIGIYGVSRYSVAQRVREIGIRMALGADGPAVRWMIFRQSAAVLGAGVMAGAPLSIVVARLYSSLLFQVEATDAATLIGVSTLLLFVALAASWMPAARAAGIDPASSLRAE